MTSPQYQSPQLQQQPSQPTGQLLNTNPASQMPADKNTASLTMPPNEAMTSLGFANNMLHHLIEYKGKKSGASQQAPKSEDSQKPVEEKPQEAPKIEQPNPDIKVNELEANVTKQIADLKQEFKDEISGISKTIHDALSEKE